MNTIQQISKKFAQHNQQARLAWPKYNAMADGAWIRKHSGLPWLKLDISIPASVIYQEIQAVKDYLVDHREDYSEHTSWRSFCIHGKAYDATREDEHYQDLRPNIWTPEAKLLMPETVNFFQHYWPSADFARLRVMELAPGGIISVHRDHEPPGQLFPVNIAITQPAGCDFYMEGFGPVPFATGSAYMLDISNRHVVINNSNEYRYHIIAHHTHIQELDKLVKRSYNLSYASPPNN
jgi:hypothetical protein